MRPGRALDVGMGQGRNTIFLAQQGWDAVGFDPADRAVAAAQQQAAQLGVKITTRVARAEDFDWGTAQWDLIVLSYVGGRDSVSNVVRSLRPGGMVLIEGFHRDATKTQPIGGRRLRHERAADAVARFASCATRTLRAWPTSVCKSARRPAVRAKAVRGKVAGQGACLSRRHEGHTKTTNEFSTEYFCVSSWFVPS
jgi:SAM-dependent methyltransferase